MNSLWIRIWNIVPTTGAVDSINYQYQNCSPSNRLQNKVVNVRGWSRPHINTYKCSENKVQCRHKIIVIIIRSNMYFAICIWIFYDLRKLKYYIEFLCHFICLPYASVIVIRFLCSLYLALSCAAFATQYFLLICTMHIRIAYLYIIHMSNRLWKEHSNRIVRCFLFAGAHLSAVFFCFRLVFHLFFVFSFSVLFTPLACLFTIYFSFIVCYNFLIQFIWFEYVRLVCRTWMCCFLWQNRRICLKEEEKPTIWQYLDDSIGA